MTKLFAEIEKSKYKDKIKKLAEIAQEFESKIDKIYEIFEKASKGLYTIAEQMAHKEIEKDPLNFIKEESVKLQTSDLHKDSFYSAMNDE
jgi:hypothetical protein